MMTRVAWHNPSSKTWLPQKLKLMKIMIIIFLLKNGLKTLNNLTIVHKTWFILTLLIVNLIHNLTTRNSKKNVLKNSFRLRLYKNKYKKIYLKVPRLLLILKLMIRYILILNGIIKKQMSIIKILVFLTKTYARTILKYCYSIHNSFFSIAIINLKFEFM